MFNMSDDNLVDELQSAVAWRQRHLIEFDDMVRRYHGSSYMDDGGRGSTGEYPENYAFSYLSLVLPRLAHDVPRIQVEATGENATDDTAKMIEMAMNIWCARSQVRRTIERIAVDMLFCWGAGMVTPKPVDAMRRIEPGHGGKQPRVYRIAPDRFVIDPAASDLSDARYVGHQYVCDIDDLAASAKDNRYLDAEAVERLVTNSDESEVYSSQHGRNIPDRGQIVVTEMWIPDAEIPESFKMTGMYHGAIVRLASSGDDYYTVISSEPEPFYGPPSGPYALFGAYTVPGDCFPLGTMTVAQSLLSELNSHLKSMHSSASAYRRLVLVDSRGTKLAQDIASTPDLHVVPVENIDRDRVVPIEIGGVTQQQLQYTSMTQDRLDRLTGLNEVIRGLVTGDATATEVSTASASSGLRIAWLQRSFADAIDNLMYVVGWYMYHGDEIEIGLGADSMHRFGSRTTFKGGQFEEDFDSYALRVSTYSLERSSEALQQKRALELLQLVMQVGQAIPAMPFVKWDRLLEMIGDQLNMPALREIISTPGAQPQPTSSPAAGAPGGVNIGSADVGGLMSAAMSGLGSGGGGASV
ncbi:MAG: hypothetical protein VX616_02125 [Actinomycetota bacterium]|nr:hypothetical protein [Actinomycetota bacterium]MEE3040124.1 hypothetical protein [Candidatus Latescibacterota bacterium]